MTIIVIKGCGIIHIAYRAHALAIVIIMAGTSELGEIAPEGVISEPMENLLQPWVLISLLTIQLCIYI